MALTLENIAKHAGVRESEVFIVVERLERAHGIQIDNVNDLTRNQYATIRAILDESFLIAVMKSSAPQSKFDYRNKETWSKLILHLCEHNLHDFSTSDIKATLPTHLRSCSAQMIAEAMKDLGYENMRVYTTDKLGNKKQARRWINMTSYSVDSKSPVTFL